MLNIRCLSFRNQFSQSKASFVIADLSPTYLYNSFGRRVPGMLALIINLPKAPFSLASPSFAYLQTFDLDEMSWPKYMNRWTASYNMQISDEL